MIDLHKNGDRAVIEIRHAKAVNPFSRGMTRQLTALCTEVEADDSLSGVLIWGGKGRSFSVGGDFADLRKMTSAAEAKLYLTDIVRSYQAVLAISKPVVTAVDHHAIGQGLQVALLGDWRIGSERSHYAMPELANGMPCPLGAALLESLLGRAAMLNLVMGCQSLNAREAERRCLIDAVCPHGDLRSDALAQLDRLCGYPAGSFRSTKRIHNGRLIKVLDEVCEQASCAHADSYAQGHGQPHFSKILGDDP